jgi:hypothetical protein
MSAEGNKAMKLSFNEAVEAQGPSVAATAQAPAAMEGKGGTAVAVRESKSAAVAVRGQYDDLVGEIQGDDLILPRINLTQKVGDLGDEFGPGVIVFQKELVLWKDGEKPLNVAILHAQKRYQENTEFGSDEMGQVVDTLDEVKALGGWIEWRDGADGRREAPPWAPRLDVICVVEAPAGADTSLFPFQFNGKAYAAAVWTLSKSGFTSAGRMILTARATFLRDGYRTGTWQVTAAKKQGPKGVYFVPCFRASGKTEEAFREFLGGVYAA